MPELPEIQAHAERLSRELAGRRLVRFEPLRFTVLKTVVPAPDAAYGAALLEVGRRGKHLLLRFEPITFVVHLMQGGRLALDPKRSAKPRGGQARFTFDDGPALLLTEQGTERRAGVWCVPTDAAATSPPLDDLGPEADTITATDLAPLLAARSQRLHGFLRDQHAIAGIGRRLANEVCHRARLSPFATTTRLGPGDIDAVVRAIHDAITESLAEERERDDMSSSKLRSTRVHGRAGEPCPVCGDVVRAVEYSGYTVCYCATCQTGGKVLADNTTSRFLK